MTTTYKADDLPGSKEIGTLSDGACVYSVDGAYVRDHIDVSWIGGGSGLENDFISPKEIWVEQMADEDDQEALMAHEISEYLLMEYGKMDYEKAHEMANSIEQVMRGGEEEEPSEEPTEGEDNMTSSYGTGKFGGEMPLRSGLRPLGGVPAIGIHILAIPKGGEMKVPQARVKGKVNPDEPGAGAKKRAHLKNPKAKIEATMGEFKRGTLRSGGSGAHVTNRAQAIAIALSQARKAGARIPQAA